MKVKESILLSLLMTIGHLGFSQTEKDANATGYVEFKSDPKVGPLVILKSDERSLELDPKKGEEFDFHAIDTKWIKSITVLKDPNVLVLYGDRGENGVLIVQLVDHYVFAKPALIKSTIRN